MLILATQDCASSWHNPQTIFTGVIAAATLVYVGCTILLWRATRDAAQAATVSADAARKSADFLAALNRPYMGVHRVAFTSGPSSQNGPVWQISWEIKNFGTLPALGVEGKVELLIGDTIQFAELGPKSAEVFPQSEPVPTVMIYKLEEPYRRPVIHGDDPLTVRVHISYRASDGQRYTHRADAKFNAGFGTFSVVDSDTKAL